MSSFTKIKSSDIKEGMRFSAPVFFDDGKNMFLAEGKAAKPYHIVALKRWAIPYLLTYGHLLENGGDMLPSEGQPVEDIDPVEDLEPFEDGKNRVGGSESLFLNERMHIA